MGKLIRKPEKIVEMQVLDAAKHLGMHLHVYDSKASYSLARGGYSKNRSIVEGHPDVAGCDANGFAVYLELKAPGKLKTLRPLQVKFLQDKIDRGCFAACVDSADLVFDLYLKWKQQGREALQLHLDSIIR